ncbi:hypothetical protein ACXDKJ_000912 [Klebsiella quasipneumoniae]
MMKSVAQLSLKPINYDGVHALPINECVKDAAHETDLSIRFKQEVETDQYAFVCSVTRQSDTAHETDLSIRFKQEVETDQYAFVCSVTRQSDNQKLRGDILYATTRDVVSLNGFKY